MYSTETVVSLRSGQSIGREVHTGVFINYPYASIFLTLPVVIAHPYHLHFARFVVSYHNQGYNIYLVGHTSIVGCLHSV